MPVYDIYSKRKKRQENAGHPDVYKYDEIPEGLRIQIIHIWKNAIGTWRTGYHDYSNEPPNNMWIAIHDILCRELGRLTLGEERDTEFENCCTFLLGESNIDYVLSLIEVSFKMIEVNCSELSDYEKSEAGISQDHEGAINELNTRFKEHGDWLPICWRYDCSDGFPICAY